MGRVVSWLVAVGAIVLLAILLLHRRMQADAAVAKEEKILRKAAAGDLTAIVDKMEGQLRAACERAKVAEEGALAAEERFNDAVARARSLWRGQQTGG